MSSSEEPLQYEQYFDYNEDMEAAVVAEEDLADEDHTGIVIEEAVEEGDVVDEAAIVVGAPEGRGPFVEEAHYLRLLSELTERLQTPVWEPSVR